MHSRSMKARPRISSFGVTGVKASSAKATICAAIAIGEDTLGPPTAAPCAPAREGPEPARGSTDGYAQTASLGTVACGRHGGPRDTAASGAQELGHNQAPANGGSDEGRPDLCAAERATLCFANGAANASQSDPAGRGQGGGPLAEKSCPLTL